MITIRPERKEDYTAIHEINVLAFGRENEARLVKTLRKSSHFIPDFSLVALIESRVVGHILFTPIAIQTKNGSLPALALAPMAVHPEFQNQGSGSKLVRQGLGLCRNQGYRIVVVVGTQNTIPALGSLPQRRRGLKHHSLFQMKSLWFSSLFPVL